MAVPGKSQKSESIASGRGSLDSATGAKRDRPWLIRTYSGHSSAAVSNALYRQNLAKGQTGLSVAFDLPTQTGYDSDSPMARGEVGKVGVPICHLGDMMTLFDQIPLAEMNTSMTINATASWLLSLYIAAAEKQGASRDTLAGTTQNDIVKEYLSRGTYIFPPRQSLKLTTDVIAFTQREVPKFNPVNVCSYHLQEAGATPVQEMSFALANACAILDKVKERGEVRGQDFSQVVGRISFFVNAGPRFVTELCKMIAFAELWDEIARERYLVNDPKYRRFRYGMQVNSLGLTEQQPENNVYRILISMLAVVLSKRARARAIQLPAWNEALGLPRPWDQQWSLRLQQIMAYETDILEYDDIFSGSKVIEDKVEELKTQAREEIERINVMGGVIAAINNSYMKHQLVMSNAARLQAIENGDWPVVGVNCYRETLSSPLVGDDAILTVDAKVESQQIKRLKAWRKSQDSQKVDQALAQLRVQASEEGNIMEASIACAKAGVTTGQWTDVLRQVYGEYRAPTGLAAGEGAPGMATGSSSNANVAGTNSGISPGQSGDKDRISSTEMRKSLQQSMVDLDKKLGRRAKILIGKPGLDGHSNGAEQIAVRARDAGFEVIYEGIRLTPEQIVNTALEESVHLVGLSILSGSHTALVKAVMEQMSVQSLSNIPVIVGGIIPDSDADKLKKMGVVAVYTPKDFSIWQIMRDMADIIADRF